MSVAYYGLHHCAELKSGQTLLINNAGGALGQAVALIANLLGLRVIAAVKTKAEKEALQTCHGTRNAHVLYAWEIPAAKAVQRLTEGAGVDAVFNISIALPAEIIAVVKAFGTVINFHQQSTSCLFGSRAVKYVSFDTGDLVRHLPSTASSAFKTVLSLLPDNAEGLVPITAVPISDVASAFKVVQGQKFAGKTILLAKDNAIVSVKQTVAPMTALPHVGRIIQAVNELSVPQDQKEALLALIGNCDSAGNDTSSSCTGNDTPSSTRSGNMSVEWRLATASSLQEARGIILEEQTKKISSLISVHAEQLDPLEPLADLGLDSLIAIEFKNWLSRSLGADIRVHDILDASGLLALAELVTPKSKFVPDGLPEKSTEPSPPKQVAESQPKPIGGRQTSNLQEAEVRHGVALNNIANGIADWNSNMNGTSSFRRENIDTNGAGKFSKSAQLQSKVDRCFSPKEFPKYPLPPLEAILDGYLTGIKAFTTQEEFEKTFVLAEQFKTPGSKGRILYDRAATRYADPSCQNWEHELQLRRGFLDRRAPLVPWCSFWFSLPLSKCEHSQSERAALITFTANQFKLKLKSGLIKPVVLNEQELTTAYQPYIFNAVRVPRMGSDKMERYPHADHCVVLWRGHAFKLDLVAEGQPRTFDDLLGCFRSILEQDLERSNVSIFTSDDRDSWAATRQTLQRLDPVNVATIATIDASAFIVALDEAMPLTATDRARQFHFGGERDAANRWHDKSIQFVVCSNGSSGIVAEHTMLDALTLSELLNDLSTAIRTHNLLDTCAVARKPALIPVTLPLKIDTSLRNHINKVHAKYAASTREVEHAYLLFEGYGSAFLRSQKLSPKSVFQMVVQLAALATFGFTPPCWETVNQAHYHLGRVDIIQVIVPAVANFVQAAGDASISLSQRRALLVDAIRAHVNTVNKAGQNLGWERSLTALRALAENPQELPELYNDPVHGRVRPRLMMSNCFETGMMEKGCLWKDKEAVWSHYEVYDGR